MGRAIENIFYYLFLADRENDLAKRLQYLSTAISLLKAKIQTEVPDDQELSIILTYPKPITDDIIVDTTEVSNKYDLIAEPRGVLPMIRTAIKAVLADMAALEGNAILTEDLPMYLQAYVESERKAAGAANVRRYGETVLLYGKDAIYSILIALGWDTVSPRDIFPETKNTTLPKRSEKTAPHTL